MAFKIIRNDITKMHTQAIVNTASPDPVPGPGCDQAVYGAAGYEKLLAYRRDQIGSVPEGEVFITPGFDLPADYIIHAVSPLYIDGRHGEEKLLRSCYQKSLQLAADKGISSIAFPLISTGSFGYPKEEGMRIAVDEIQAFLLHTDLQVWLVVFDEKASRLGKNLYPDLESYIDRHYVEKKSGQEYGKARTARTEQAGGKKALAAAAMPPLFPAEGAALPDITGTPGEDDAAPDDAALEDAVLKDTALEDAALEDMEQKLAQRISHMSDTFAQYLLYLIQEKGMKNADVYKRAIVDKKVFSKIKNHPDYHPQKLTALCLCIGARLNLDESRDLLARAGYALSPCDKTDIIFSYFIENEIYDMIELDIQLEEHGLPCIIS